MLKHSYHAHISQERKKISSCCGFFCPYFDCQMNFEINSLLSPKLGHLNLAFWFETSDYAQI